MKKILGFLIGIYAAKFIYSKISLAVKYELSLKNFVVAGSLLQPELTLNFLFQNKTIGEASLDGLVGVVKFNNSNLVIGNVKLLKSIVLAPETNTVIPIAVTGTNFSILKTIQEYIGKKKLDIHFVGVAKIDGFNFDIDLINELI